MRRFSGRGAHSRHRVAGPDWGSSHLGRWLLLLLVVAVVVYGAVQWLRPVPAPVFHDTTATSLRLPGTPPTLPWPSGGASAVSEVGVGSLGQSGTSQPLPVASIIKVLTAEVVLHDHPLSPGATGPGIPVPADVVAAYQSGVAQRQSEVPVTAGETLSELQALEGLLISSGNDMAQLLAEWDAGTVAAFVAKMNDTAKSFGLASTHVTDPSGLDAGTVSTPADLIALGEKAMADPLVAQIVAMPSVQLPGSPVIFNFDYDVGHNGIVGIKTGSDGAAGGCFLFDAQQTIAGQKVSLIGVILGQQGGTPLQSALTDAVTLVQAAFAGIKPLPVVASGQVVGKVVTASGASVPVTAGSSPQVLGWPGLKLAAKVRTRPISSSMGAGAQVGTLEVTAPGAVVTVPLRLAGAIPAPGLEWRLTNI